MEGTRLSTSKVTMRVVLRHSTGPLAGLHQILGVLTTPVAAVPAASTLKYGPVDALKTALRDRKDFARYIRYQEVA